MARQGYGGLRYKTFKTNRTEDQWLESAHLDEFTTATLFRRRGNPDEVGWLLFERLGSFSSPKKPEYIIVDRGWSNSVPQAKIDAMYAYKKYLS